MVFGFLKKKKRKAIDLPPPPPEMSDMPSFSKVSLPTTPEQAIKEDIKETTALKHLFEAPSIEKQRPLKEAVKKPMLFKIKENVPFKRENLKFSDEQPKKERLFPQIIKPKFREIRPIEPKPFSAIIAPKIEDITPSIKHLEKKIPKKHFFVRSDKYKNILDNINSIKGRLKNSEELLSKLNEIKNTKDKEFERWIESLENIQKKCSFIDKTLFEL